MKTKDTTVGEFLRRLSGGSATPGGGSVAALSGALSAALCAMVGRLTIGRAKYQEVWAEMEQMQSAADRLALKLLDLVDKDIAAYDGVITALKMPKQTEEHRSSRQEAVQEATKQAALVPMETVRLLAELTGLVEKAFFKGNPNCLTDAGVAAVLIRAAAQSAAYNVQVNLSGIDDEGFVRKIESELQKALKEILAPIDRLNKMVGDRLEKQ
jgi:formiminotetrahydrofolate cyclodeaminase